MNFKLIKLLFIMLLNTIFLACNSDKTFLLQDGTKAVGNISEDTVYDGPIKFYDGRGNHLLKIYNYSNGRKEGAAIEFFPNGDTAVRLTFRDDKKYGEAFYYTESGKMLQKSFFYYDLIAGSSINFNDSLYSFFSLDGRELLNISYKRMRNFQSITDILSQFFFLQKASFVNVADERNKNAKYEFFIYLPSPPDFNFEYSLVGLNPSGKVDTIYQSFAPEDIWTTFTLHDSVAPTQRFAIRLRLRDLNGEMLNLFKILN